MEVEDAKFEKTVLESNIKRLIDEFYKVTGLAVETIELAQVRHGISAEDECRLYRTVVKTKVRL